MDIPGLSMSLSAIQLNTAVGTRVLAGSLDTGRQLGEGLVKMIDSAAMERSVNPAVGSLFDTSI